PGARRWLGCSGCSTTAASCGSPRPTCRRSSSMAWPRSAPRRTASSPRPSCRSPRCSRCRADGARRRPSRSDLAGGSAAQPREVGWGSPEGKSNLPEGRSNLPRRAVELPRREVEPPRREVEPPRREVQPPPKGSPTSPKGSPTSPKGSPTSMGQGVDLLSGQVGACLRLRRLRLRRLRLRRLCLRRLRLRLRRLRLRRLRHRRLRQVVLRLRVRIRHVVRRLVEPRRRPVLDGLAQVRVVLRPIAAAAPARALRLVHRPARHAPAHPELL